MELRICYPILIAGLITTTALAQFDVYVSSRGSSAVHRYDLNGNFLGQFVQPGSGGLNGTEDILFHPDGTVLVSGFNNTVIKRYNGTTGAYIGDFSSGYSLSTPSKMSLGPDSMVYVTQWGGSQKIVRFDLSGNFVDEWSNIAVPNGLYHVRDSLGIMYIATFVNGLDGKVMKFDTSGTYIGDHIDSSVLQGPTTPRFTDNGHMMVADWTTGVIREFDQNGAHLGPVISSIAQPEGMSILPNGDLLIGDWTQDAVYRFDAAGTSLNFFTQGNGLVDVNSVRLGPQITMASVHEDVAEVPQLQILPSIGPGPFQITVGRADVIEVYDANGKLIHAKPLPRGIGQLRFQLPDQAANGIYSVRTMNSGKLMSTGEILLVR